MIYTPNMDNNHFIFEYLLINDLDLLMIVPNYLHKTKLHYTVEN